MYIELLSYSPFLAKHLLIIHVIQYMHSGNFSIDKYEYMRSPKQNIVNICPQFNIICHNRVICRYVDLP